MSREGGRGFWPLRDLPVVGWLVAALVVSLVHPFVAAPRWLMIHLLLLGAVTHSIVVWSRYFSDALLHSNPMPGDRQVQNRRLGLLNVGVLAVVIGVPNTWWPLTVVGASAVAGAVLWHGLALARMRRRALPSRFGATVRYYLAAAAFLPLGAGLGTALAHGVGGRSYDAVVLAHASINVLGWMGLTVLGTLMTLWPTMLRTRIAVGAERAAARALPILVASVLVAAGGALAELRLVAALGFAGYLIGMIVAARPLAVAARGKPPLAYPTWSVLAAVSWLAGILAALAVGISTAPDWAEATSRFRWLTPFLAAGFGAQVLLGALSYLVPVVLGGGPQATRAANTVLDRGGALRITAINAGLVACVLPVPSVVRVLSSTVVLVGLGSFLPLLVLAIRASVKARGAPTAPVPAPAAHGPRAPAGDRPPGQRTGLAATGLAAVVLAVALGAAIDPSALGGTPAVDSSAGVAPTGQTTTVQVKARDMRFVPDTIDVPIGNRLVIDLENTDRSMVHDLVLSSGADSRRLSPGRSARVDVGVVGRDIDGWCSVVGHRQMGMVLTVRATGAPAGTSAAGSGAARTAGPDPSDGHHGDAMPTATGGSDAADDLDLLADPGPGFVAHPAALPPLTAERTHRLTFTVSEVEREVSPGVTQRLWTYNGTAPGPALHGRVGDSFEITLINDGSIGHGIDFHAGALAADGPMRTLEPGASLVYRFRATRAGVWLYHCSTMPMSAHIANGMFGAVVIEPPGLPAVDRSYLLVQSELYLGAQGGPVDAGKVNAEQPDAVVFNGYTNQYDWRPLPARVGERVRVWVLDAGPNRATSFHVIGGQFDTTWLEGSYLLRPGPASAGGGSQALAVAVAQGGFVELTFPEAGTYPFVSHVMVDAERGAHGAFAVSPQGKR